MSLIYVDELFVRNVRMKLKICLKINMLLKETNLNGGPIPIIKNIKIGSI